MRNANDSRAPIVRARIPNGANPDVLTFSHLRWDFVFQRPQHLMSRFAKSHRVFFFEEPVLHDEPCCARLDVRPCEKTGVVVVTPHLERHLSRFAMDETQANLLNAFCGRHHVSNPIKWYYSPSLYCYSKDLEASAVVYDCMDELANFRFASPQLPLMERDLMREADLVFTGGRSLYNAKRPLHPQVYCFPSSVDRAHFSTARKAPKQEPVDQEHIPHPRLGFYGVIDERMDFALLSVLADCRPDWQIVLVGPVAKVSPDELPRQPNIHYLGPKSYEELPSYLSGWNVALMPFAINEATRYISPTKTPEYLAGGKPVVSTPITDVVEKFGKLTGVKIAQTPSAFAECCEAALSLDAENPQWLAEADALLETTSWDRTFAQMAVLLEAAIQKRQETKQAAGFSYRPDAVSEHALRIEP